jgi:hypothetical protein
MIDTDDLILILGLINEVSRESLRSYPSPTESMAAGALEAVMCSLMSNMPLLMEVVERYEKERGQGEGD